MSFQPGRSLSPAPVQARSPIARSRSSMRVLVGLRLMPGVIVLVRTMFSFVAVRMNARIRAVRMLMSVLVPMLVGMAV
jgi:hypothetical protein